MEDDDHKHLYEVNEMQDYDQLKGYQPSTGHDIKLHQVQQPVFSVGKVGSVILTVAILLILVALVIIIAMSGLTITQYNTCPANCDGSAQLGASTSGLPNCSVVSNTWADQLAQNNTMLQWQVNRMAQNNTMLQWQLNQVSAMLRNEVQWQIGQVFNMTQNTASKIDSFANDHATSMQNITDLFGQVLSMTGDSVNKLTNIIGSLSNIKETGITTAGVIDDILVVVNELLQLQNASLLFNSITPVSCQDIKNVLPSSPTGYYHVNSRNIYCNMGTLCGSGGGWTRLAYLDMADSTYSCPSGFSLFQSGGVRACGRGYSNSPSCTSLPILTNGISYSQICGRVIGYQIGNPDALHNGGAEHNDINSWYADGVSITRGSPRQHVWTFTSGYTQVANSAKDYVCPCATGGTQQVQSFIGTNYYCESGNPNPWTEYNLYTADPVWDGENCGQVEAACCTSPDQPWFHRDYGTGANITDNLELRVCGDEPTNNEDTPVSLYEIYVK